MPFEINAATAAISNDVTADIKMETDVMIKNELLVEDEYS